MPETDYQAMLKKYSAVSETEPEQDAKAYVPGHMTEHVVDIETVSQPEETVIHYDDGLEELETALREETAEHEQDDKEVAGR